MAHQELNPAKTLVEIFSSAQAAKRKRFDNPLAEEFRRVRGAYMSGRRTEILESESIKSGIASIVWRASISSANIYKEICDDEGEALIATE